MKTSNENTFEVSGLEEINPNDFAQLVTTEFISIGRDERLTGIVEVRETEAAKPRTMEPPVDRLARFIERFVFLKTRSLYRLLALWVTATHMYADFDYMGYIFASSPEPQSGKSRLLEILELFVASPSGILISPSEAVLFRTAEGHTQFLDEVDGWTNKDELRNVLNAGFHKGATVQRMDEGANGYEVKGFPVYAPRVLAGIGNKILSATTLDRTFSIEMVRQMPDERRQRFRARMVKPEADELRKELETWVGRHKGSIIDCYENYDFPYLQNFRDRTVDVTQPLAAVVEVAYKGRAICAEVIRELIEAVALTRNDQEPVTDDHRILQALEGLARTEDPLVGNATELAERCAQALGENPDSLPIAVVLRRYGFETKSIRKDGAARYRYSLSHDALAELLARYGGRAEKAEATVEPQSKTE